MAGKYKVRQLKQLPNIMSCVLTHEAVDSSCEFTWNGPKLNAIWPEVLAFFNWTNDTMRSESQVRLFVNSETKEWKAWAFPQRARTGMSAHELDERDEGYEKTKEQRQLFKESEGWNYWGTVHHHCGGQAFQSTTDTNNEKSQDGLHITVGGLGGKQYSLHHRVYVGGFELTDARLSNFWDVGNEFEGLPDRVKLMLKTGFKEDLTKMQMGTPPEANQTFPDQWKENVIDVSPKVETMVSSHREYQTTFQGSPIYTVRPLYLGRAVANWEIDKRKAQYEIDNMIKDPRENVCREEVILCLDTISQGCDDLTLNLLDIITRNDVLPDKMSEWLVKAWFEDAKKDADKAAAEAMEAEGGGQQKGKPNGKGKKKERSQTTIGEILGGQGDYGGGYEFYGH